MENLALKIKVTKAHLESARNEFNRLAMFGHRYFSVEQRAEMEMEILMKIQTLADQLSEYETQLEHAA